MDDEVIGSYGEITGLDINAKFFAQLLGGRSALRDFLNSPDALVGEIAEQQVSGHGNPPSKKAVGSYRVHMEDYAIRTIRRSQQDLGIVSFDGCYCYFLMVVLVIFQSHSVARTKKRRFSNELRFGICESLGLTMRELT